VITCPKCGHENQDTAMACANCGMNRQLTPGNLAVKQSGTERRPVGRLVYLLWAGVGILGIVMGYLLGTKAPYQGHYEGENWMLICFFSIPVIPVLGTGVGISAGWLAHRGLRGAIGHNAAIGLATVCAAAIATISGFVIVAISLWAIEHGLIL
jgi:hypothetical protein